MRAFHSTGLALPQASPRPGMSRRAAAKRLRLTLGVGGVRFLDVAHRGARSALARGDLDPELNQARNQAGVVLILHTL